MTENTLTSHLCVGGPYAGLRVDARPNAGRQYDARHYSGFDVFESPSISAADFDPDKPPAEPVAIKSVRYRTERFHTPQGDVTFWVPEGQTPLQTITLLLESFEEHCKLKRLGARILPAGATP